MKIKDYAIEVGNEDHIMLMLIGTRTECKNNEKKHKNKDISE